MKREFYESSDLGLAAALVASKFDLIDVNKENPNRAIFIFSNSDSVRSAVELYWNGKLMVSASRYFEIIKHIKSRLYS